MGSIIPLILFILLYSNLFPQSLSGVLSINPFPSPYISEWQRNASSMGN